MAKTKEKYGLKRYIYEDSADKMGVVKQRMVMTMRSFMKCMGNRYVEDAFHAECDH